MEISSKRSDAHSIWRLWCKKQGFDGFGFVCCAMVQVPKVVCTLRSLEVLTLSNNQLQHLPPEFGALTCLHDVSLHHNQLTTLPVNAFRRLTQLRTLDLSSNRFQSIPQALLPPAFGDSAWGEAGSKRQEDNQQQMLWLPSLTSLELRQNQISGEVPAAIANLMSLEWLDLSRNQLTSVDALLPLALGNGKGGLGFLDISYNPHLNLSASTLQSLSAIPEFSHERCGTGGSGTTITHSLSVVPPLSRLTDPDLKSSLPAERRVGTPKHMSDSSKQQQPSARPLPSPTAPPAAAPTKHILQWSNADVLKWLEREGFGSFCSAFEENEITG
jgi:hypothetical protein